MFRPRSLLLTLSLVCALTPAVAATPAAQATTPAAAGASAPAGASALDCRHRNAEIERSIGYCQAVRVGDVLYISGVPAAGPMEQALPQVYAQLRAVLAANGLDFSHVAKETLYATDLNAVIRHAELRKRAYGGHTPAASWVQVERLFMPEFVLAVELIAHYPPQPAKVN